MHARDLTANRRRGAVLVAVLFAMLLLAGFVAYIFNVGNHLTKKTETVNAADAAVVGGSGWVARSMNLVSMNNVEITRILAQIQVLDATPLAAAYARADTEAALEACRRQIQRHNLPPWLLDGLAEVESDLRDQAAWLEQVDLAVNQSPQFDMRALTHYVLPEDVVTDNTRERRGSLWQAIEALSAMSVAAMQSLDDATHANVRYYGQANQSSPDGQAELLLPDEVWLPWYQSDFVDFHRPVTKGLLPRNTDDSVVRRGPYDTVLGWRDLIFEPQPEFGRRADEPLETVDRWDSPWSYRLEFEPPDPEGDPIAYRVYGPYESLLRETERELDASLPNNAFKLYLRQLADSKMAQLFSGATRDRRVVEPRWLAGYAAAKAVAESDQPADGEFSRIKNAQYLVLDFEQVQGLSPLTGLPVGLAPDPRYVGWSIVRPHRQALNPPRLTRTARHVWQDESTTRNRVRGIQTTRVRCFIFAGANIGRELRVRNPNNFTAAGRNDGRRALSGPVRLDVTALDHDHHDARRDRLEFSVIASQDASAPLMQGVFEGSADRPKRPISSSYAVASAKVFNTHSWDLWTQMWHAQLIPNRAERIDVLLEAPLLQYPN